MDTKAILEKVELFKGLSAAQLQPIIDICEVVQYGKSSLIFSEGDTERHLYIILEGTVSVEMALPDKVYTEQLAPVVTHEIFGELALLDGHQRSATVRAIGNVKVLLIRRENLAKVMNIDHHIAAILFYNLARILAARLRETNVTLQNALL